MLTTVASRQPVVSLGLPFLASDPSILTVAALVPSFPALLVAVGLSLLHVACVQHPFSSFGALLKLGPLAAL